MRYLLVLALLWFTAVNNFAVCSEHGVKSAWNGNKKFADSKHTVCQYEHPLSTGGVHKFWSECND